MQALFLLEGNDPAEEELLEMQSVGAVLEALGLCFVADGDDPRVWRMAEGRAKPQTAVQALNKLLAHAQVRTDPLLLQPSPGWQSRAPESTKVGCRAGEQTGCHAVNVVTSCLSRRRSF